MTSHSLGLSWPRLFSCAATPIAIVIGALAVFAPAASAGDQVTLESLHKQKLAVAKDWYKAESVAWEAGVVTISDLYAASIGWKEATYELAANKQDQLQALEAHRDRMIALEKENEALKLSRVGGNEHDKDLMIQFWVLEAKIWVAEEATKEKRQQTEH